jgi:hypothetical protein
VCLRWWRGRKYKEVGRRRKGKARRKKEKEGEK